MTRARLPGIPGSTTGPSELPSHRLAVALALIVAFLWSTSWILIRWGLDGEDLPPLTFAGLRYGLAAAVLVGWLFWRRPALGPRPLGRRLVGRLVLLGIVLFAVTQGAQFVALAEQPAATTSLVLSLTPLLVGATAGIALAEVPTRWQALGTLRVAIGAWLYFAGDLGATVGGMLGALTALIANVVSSLLGRDINRSTLLPAAAVTAISMSVGAALLLATGVLLEGGTGVTAKGWLIVTWLAVVNTAIAFSLWNLSLRRLSALESAAINDTMLVQVALLAWLLLGEAPGPVGLVGILVVSAGVYLTQVGRRAQADRGVRSEGPP
jgi:drug/metabolite transporter (DMT)-like permease